ncbi:MAG: hypothetical protein EP330_28930 [Deltaproteobacteria bacterium]|nr:MAG: hypothetical protein EP330_28930 [Deltaproteobacteria bacterium]
MFPLLFAAAFAAPTCDSLARDFDDAGRCGTELMHLAQAHCPELLVERGLSTGELRPPEGPMFRGTKVTRDSWGLGEGALAGNLVETTNFAVKWGPDSGVSQPDVAVIASHFEDAWAAEVESWGYGAPEQTSGYRFNVYIGDTGGAAPSAFGAGGYFWYDDDGYPMIVMNRDTLFDRNWAADVAAHEFFHAIQGATGTYDYENAGAWYWEATAVWAELEMFGATPSNSGFLFGFAALPDLGVGFFDYPDEGLLQEYHQYGAFVFIRHLSEVSASEALVKDTWMSPITQTRDPLREVDARLEALGSSLAEAHTDFARRLPHLDFPEGDVFEQALAPYEGYPGSRPVQGSISVNAPTSDTPVEAPMSWGVNVWYLFAEDEIDITFEATSTPDAFTAAIVGFVDGERQVVELPTDGTTFRTESIAAMEDRRVVVTAQAGTADYRSTFGYTIHAAPADYVAPEPDPGPDPLTPEELAAACGCSQGPTTAWFVLPLVLLAVRQRRK